MKRTKKFVVFFICSMSILQGVPVNASVVGYQSNRYAFDVYVVGSGGLYYKDQYIQNYKRIKLEVGESITLSIKANTGSSLTSIQYNGVYLQKDNLTEITHVQENKTTTLTVVFSKDDPPIPIPPTTNPNPTPPTDIVEQPKKEIVADTIITKDIPMGEITNGITDEFLRRYIHSSRDYIILSHNVKEKPGTYTILIELDNGEQKTLKINVIKEHKKAPSIVKNKNYYAFIILLLLIVYSTYMHQRIKKLKNMEEKWK